MKKLKIMIIALFFLLLLLPVATFNREKNAVSEIDNRVLAESLLGSSDDMTESIEMYLDDRIGFRNEMIRTYTRMNDILFHEMVHHAYTYGKDGYIFMRTGGNSEFWDFHIEFADMISRIQEYCEDRDVPFLFAFNPSKITVLRDKLEPGMNYDNSWVDRFFEELDKRGVNYVDNTGILEEKTRNGEAVFNQKYDAGHWNDLGAFYGVNNILEALKKDVPAVHINGKEEFEIGEWTAETLPISETPIHDVIPSFTPKLQPEDITQHYDSEVRRDEQNRHFAYLVNGQRKAEGAPKALVFQGSYMNGAGQKYLANSLGEYVAVHDYVNITDFDYYYNIFKPECVIFEVGEYTVNPESFPYDLVEGMHLNPLLDSFEELPEEERRIGEIGVNMETGEALTVVRVSDIPEDTRYAYLILDGEVFDLMDGGDNGYTVTVENSAADAENIKVAAVSGGKCIYFQ